MLGGAERTPGRARIGGFTIAPTASTEPDTLAYVHMTVLHEIASDYLVTNFTDDLAGTADGAFVPVPIEPTSWGQIKVMYGADRSGDVRCAGPGARHVCSKIRHTGRQLDVSPDLLCRQLDVPPEALLGSLPAPSCAWNMNRPVSRPAASRK